MREIKEHSTVIVEIDDVERFGTIVHIYSNTETYEVEFINQLGILYVETIQGEQVKKVLNSSLSESEATDLMNARLMRMKNLTEDEINRAKLLQTKLKK